MSLTDFTARLYNMKLPSWVMVCLSWVLALNAVTTGWDYIHTPAESPTAKSLTMVVRLASLHTWGIWFLIAGGMLTVGLLIQRHVLVWLGHLLCALMYAGFTAATAQAVWELTHSPTPAQGSIWRAVTQSLVVTVLHILWCYLRGPIPRKGEEL